MRDIIIFVALFLFGVGYNFFVAWLERRGYHEGYVAYLVVAGTLITILATYSLIGRDAMLLVLACFVASGTPMIVGSCYRHVKEREKGGGKGAWEEAKRACHARLEECHPHDDTQKSGGICLERQSEESSPGQPQSPGAVDTGP